MMKTCKVLQQLGVVFLKEGELLDECDMLEFHIGTGALLADQEDRYWKRIACHHHTRWCRILKDIVVFSDEGTVDLFIHCAHPNDSVSFSLMGDWVENQGFCDIVTAIPQDEIIRKCQGINSARLRNNPRAEVANKFSVPCLFEFVISEGDPDRIEYDIELKFVQIFEMAAPTNLRKLKGALT
jgi:hypothetical protein